MTDRMTTIPTDETTAMLDGKSPALRVRATRVLIWTSGALSVALLLAGIYIFLATVVFNGPAGAALIHDYYLRILSTCL